ncbi:hypothetical protein [Breoghania sp. L-A4]|uniref:hypothetical protein n=1 Tax=Breoghania sp. L-A4 TaxID=2304600 RepID=UPI0013C2DDC7|nr:hypothetical protein [Breoghania sp. L-A4]
MDLQTVPDSFMGRVLNEFGVQWTHLFIVSGVALTAFGLDTVLDPSVWIFGIIGSFVLVYVFREYISQNFPLTFFVSALIFGCLVMLVTPVGSLLPSDLGATVRTDKRWFTLYCSMAFGMPLGVCLISYNKRPESLLLALPESIIQSAKSQIFHSPFLIDKATYLIELSEDGSDGVLFSFELHFKIVNRSKKIARYQDIFDPSGEQSCFKSASIGEEVIDVLDPDYSHGRGIVISKEVDGRSTFDVKVAAETHYPRVGSELIGCYFPARELEVRVTCPPSLINVSVQSMLMEKIPVSRMHNGDLLVSYNKGILPFQGVRLHWSRKAEE